jgi:hypothetical protein
MPTGEQKQKKRTIHALPKPDNFIRYRQTLPPAGFAHVSYNSVEEAHGRAERGLPVTLVIGKDDCEVAAAPAVTAAESIRDFSRP